MAKKRATKSKPVSKTPQGNEPVKPAPAEHPTPAPVKRPNRVQPADSMTTRDNTEMKIVQDLVDVQDDKCDILALPWYLYDAVVRFRGGNNLEIIPGSRKAPSPNMALTKTDSRRAVTVSRAPG